MKKFLFLIVFITGSVFSQNSINNLSESSQGIENNPLNFDASIKEPNLLIGLPISKQFHKKIIQFKNDDNLEEYLYAHFDEYVKSKNKLYLQEAILKKWRMPKSVTEKIALLHLKINIAYSYFISGNIAKSITNYEKSLHYYQTNNLISYNIIEYCLKPLGNNYTRVGDYTQANEIFKYTIQLTEKQNNKEQLIATYQNLSIQYQSIHNFNDAIQILEKALKIPSISVLKKSAIYSLIAKNYYKKNLIDKALTYVNRSENLIHNKSKNNTSQKNEIIKGLCFYKKENFEKSKKAFLKALDLSIKLYGKNNRETAKIYNLLAKTTVRKNKNEALLWYQKSLATLLVNFKPKNRDESPKIDQFFAENTLKEAFDGRATIYTQIANNHLAITNYNLAFKIEKLLQKTLTNQESQLIQQTEIKKRNEKITDLYYKQYLATKQQKYINLAFKNIENSKAFVLSNALNYNYSHKNNYENDLSLKVKNLRREKAILKKNILLEELKNKDADLELLKNYNTKIIKIGTALQVIDPNTTPDRNNAILIKDIQQKLLLKNQIIIEFFNTDAFIYIFKITKNKPLQLRRIAKSRTLEHHLKNYISLFTSKNGNRLKNNYSEYHKTAFYLYKQLLQPELNNETVTILTIIPDGKLNFIAFDALLTQKTNSQSFEKLPYLILKNKINLGYSVSILYHQKLVDSNLKVKKTIGFFPVFENNFRDLQEISYTIEEEKALKKYTNGLYLEKETATKKQFLKHSKNYHTIHLSTHASAGDFYTPAHIEFRDSTLYLPEIYGLNMNTNLMVMSACETGIGALQKGEGVMSLARGFAYSGVKNLLVSLWKVNDKSTSQLMQNFYKHYKNNNSKIDALRQAKLDYLTNKNISNLKKTPYYWSSFVFIGNAESPITSTLNPYTYLIFGLLILVFIIFLTKVKSKSINN